MEVDRFKRDSIDQLSRSMDVMQRGKPDFKDKNLVHLRIEQNRPGMIEHSDYSIQTKCSQGNYHMYFTNDKSKVTCSICQGKF